MQCIICLYVCFSNLQTKPTWIGPSGLGTRGNDVPRYRQVHPAALLIVSWPGASCKLQQLGAPGFEDINDIYNNT